MQQRDATRSPVYSFHSFGGVMGELLRHSRKKTWHNIPSAGFTAMFLMMVTAFPLYVNDIDSSPTANLACYVARNITRLRLRSSVGLRVETLVLAYCYFWVMPVLSCLNI